MPLLVQLLPLFPDCILIGWNQSKTIHWGYFIEAQEKSLLSTPEFSHKTVEWITFAVRIVILLPALRMMQVNLPHLNPTELERGQETVGMNERALPGSGQKCTKSEISVYLHISNLKLTHLVATRHQDKTADKKVMKLNYCLANMNSH